MLFLCGLAQKPTRNMKNNIPKKQLPAASPTKKLVSHQLREARAAIKKLLGQETNNALEELADSYVVGVEEAGEIARVKAIEAAIAEIPNNGRELVDRLMAMRDSSGKKASVRKQRGASSANENSNKKGARRES